ncbi:hypothetical protein PR048_014648 [Dryococelus australis]|uniref:Uncharacterized protein n=1 Tax=Dryococelus australis TaxID=614101 RepID=A0ABQ9HF01_9NEOP|nr:hypothetical protein PR048_014648 [Dryococelus australis]
MAGLTAVLVTPVSKTIWQGTSFRFTSTSIPLLSCFTDHACNNIGDFPPAVTILRPLKSAFTRFPNVLYSHLPLAATFLAAAFAAAVVNIGLSGALALHMTNTQAFSQTYSLPCLCVSYDIDEEANCHDAVRFVGICRRIPRYIAIAPTVSPLVAGCGFAVGHGRCVTGIDRRKVVPSARPVWATLFNAALADILVCSLRGLAVQWREESAVVADLECLSRVTRYLRAALPTRQPAWSDPVWPWKNRRKCAPSRQTASFRPALFQNSPLTVPDSPAENKHLISRNPFSPTNPSGDAPRNGRMLGTALIEIPFPTEGCAMAMSHIFLLFSEVAVVVSSCTASSLLSSGDDSTVPQISPTYHCTQLADALSQISADVPRRSGIAQLLRKVARDAKLSALNHSHLRGSHVGATLAEWLNCSPPTEANRAQTPAGSLGFFVSGNRAGQCSWSAGFLENLPFLPPYSPQFIGSRDPVAMVCISGRNGSALEKRNLSANSSLYRVSRMQLRHGVQRSNSDLAVEEDCVKITPRRGVPAQKRRCNVSRIILYIPILQLHN